MNGAAGLPYPVKELLTAARLEIAAELLSDGKVSLSAGRRVSTADGKHEYLFDCKRWLDALDGKAALVRMSRSTGEWTPAEVSRMPEGKVRVVTGADLGATPSHVQIREDDAATWRVLVERLETVGQPNHPVQTDHAAWALGQGDPRPGKGAGTTAFLLLIRVRCMSCRCADGCWQIGALVGTHRSRPPCCGVPAQCPREVPETPSHPSSPASAQVRKGATGLTPRGVQISRKISICAPMELRRSARSS